MFPNPAIDNVTIQLPNGTENASLEFYDYLGRLSLSKKVSSANNSININNLSNGVYLLRVVTANKIGAQKFIKNNFFLNLVFENRLNFSIGFFCD